MTFDSHPSDETTSEELGSVRDRTYNLTFLGRTLEHLGYQMYKHRDAALAELVANSWDACSTEVRISLPDSLDSEASPEIVVEDTGCGMHEDSVQTRYLVIGRNRRLDEKPECNRPVMGRKGIGKLAGFGIAEEVEILTWQDGVGTKIVLDADVLKGASDEVQTVPIPGQVGGGLVGAGSHGTRVTLRRLKHRTAIDKPALAEALGRRFGRIVHGQMAISLDGDPVVEPQLDLKYRVPDTGFETAVLEDGSEVTYYYGFARSPINSPVMRGWTVHVHGKTAQAPPFFFRVENKASGQHGTRYMTGAIEADFLDDDPDEDTDIISTDRQEIEWDSPRAEKLLGWGDKLTREALRTWANRRADAIETAVRADTDLDHRISRLDGPSQKQAISIIRKLGTAETDRERALELSGAIVRAFEYRHFHDVVAEIDALSDDPETLLSLLGHLNEWKVLESRAILEIVKGRLAIIEKFFDLIVENAPETAPRAGAENLHDLIAGSPWLIDPDWQVLAEEKSITQTLREWNEQEDTANVDRQRYDFLALENEARLIVIEIKRAGHDVRYDEMQRLDGYRHKLKRADRHVEAVVICGGSVDPDAKNLSGIDVLLWGDIRKRTQRYYEHYRAILEGDTADLDFRGKELEIAQTRNVLDRGATRSESDRRAGLGPQDHPSMPGLADVQHVPPLGSSET